LRDRVQYAGDPRNAWRYGKYVLVITSRSVAPRDGMRARPVLKAGQVPCVGSRTRAN